MKSIKVRLKNQKYLNVNFSPGDIMIDCGANVGEILSPFAMMGATVLAYEPNRYAFDKLSQKFKHMKNVKCINSAVSSEDGKTKLFLHQKSDKDPLKYSTGSSMMEGKSNIDLENYIEIEMVDLSKVIKKINNIFKKDVHILKIDIEGAECDLMEKLMDEELLKSIPYVFVETHEEKIPSLMEPTQKMISRAKKLNLNNINFNWI